MIKKSAGYLFKIVVFALIYHLVARLSLKMAYLQPNTSPVWPPTGISLVFLFFYGISFWPGISLGVLLGSVLTGAPFPLALGMAVGNTLEALIAVYLLKNKLHFHESLDRLNDIVGFSAVAFICTAISAIIGTATLILTTQTPRSSFFDVWITWWIGDLLGALVVAPIIMVWLKPHSLAKIQKNILEWFGLIILIIFTSWYVFSKQPPIDVVHQAMTYVIFPFVIWAALRFGQHGAATGIFLISAIAIWGTVNGYGPFVQDSINASLILLQTFLGVVALISLILGATTLERREAAVALQRRIEDLDMLNNASKSFLGNFDKLSIYQIICKIAVEKINANCSWIEIPVGDGHSKIPIAAYGISLDDISSRELNWAKKTESDISQASRSKDDKSSQPAKPYGVFPLTFGNAALGDLNLQFNDAALFTEEKQLLIQSYANLAAVAIQNAWLFDEVNRGNEQLHALSQRLMKAQEEERLHLSRELHDESGQILAALMVELGLLTKASKQNKKDLFHLQKIHDLSQDLQTNLHRLAANLRPASLDHLGLVKALEQYINDFSKQHSVIIDIEAVGLDQKRLPTEIETSIFRIVQESLTNVALHAEASHVDVLITYRNQHIVALIEDDGIGFITTSPAIEKQLGLFGMKERVEMLRGSFTLESAPGKGTMIKVEVPVGN
ncbi:MAG: MASE1 domain-containing protein [Anaerolineaceae bacterium]|nr:MASE1 domain-containing protein [Anaerolineaceae bacterium]